MVEAVSYPIYVQNVSSDYRNQHCHHVLHGLLFHTWYCVVYVEGQTERQAAPVLLWWELALELCTLY